MLSFNYKTCFSSRLTNFLRNISLAWNSQIYKNILPGKTIRKSQVIITHSLLLLQMELKSMRRKLNVKKMSRKKSAWLNNILSGKSVQKTVNINT